jgi:hypothetical protein
MIELFAFGAGLAVAGLSLAIALAIPAGERRERLLARLFEPAPADCADLVAVASEGDRSSETASPNSTNL